MARAVKKTRGRTSITGMAKLNPLKPTKPRSQQERRAETTRPVSAGTGRHRGHQHRRHDMAARHDRHEQSGIDRAVRVGLNLLPRRQHLYIFENCFGKHFTGLDAGGWKSRQ